MGSRRLRRWQNLSGVLGSRDPDGQQKLAKATKQLIESEIGPYHRLKYIAAHPDKSPDPTTLRRARNIATFKNDLQWVEGDARTAEKSFFKINSSASPIDATELAIIKARRKPNAVATRAMMNAGTGHKYWSDYPPETQQKIESLAREIYDSLFTPILESPVKTLELPIAGQAYSANAFKMILDLVNMVNNVTPAMWMEKPEPENPRSRKKNVGPRVEDDADGQATVEFLSRVKRVASVISGNHARSLGLHPVVYFYGATGRFQPIAFLATVKFVQEPEDRKQFNRFTGVRRQFEEFLLSHKHFVSALGHTYGGRTRSLEPLVSMYRTMRDEFSTGHDDRSVESRLLKESSSLALHSAAERKPTRRTKFSTDEKSESFLRQALDNQTGATSAAHAYTCGGSTLTIASAGRTAASRPW